MKNESAKSEGGREGDVARPSASGGSWLDQAQKVTAAIALGGVLIFGALLLAYGQFYRELGVSLNDVGVEYGKTLGGAAGLTIVLLISTTVIAAGVWFAADRLGRHVSFVPTMFCTFALLTLIAAVSLTRGANQRASAVKQGKTSRVGATPWARDPFDPRRSSRCPGRPNRANVEVEQIRGSPQATALLPRSRPRASCSL